MKISDSALASYNKTTQTYFIEETTCVFISSEEYETFMNYIRTLHRTLEGILQSISLYNEFETFKVACEAYHVSHEILYDPEKLRKFIDELSNNRSISGLDVEAALTVQPSLKIHIQAYMDQHGWPENFIFDSNKMARILVDLGLV